MNQGIQILRRTWQYHALVPHRLSCGTRIELLDEAYHFKHDGEEIIA